MNIKYFFLATLAILTSAGQAQVNDVNARLAARASSFLRGGVVATRGIVPNSMSTGAEGSATYRTAHTFPASTQDVRLSYANYYSTTDIGDMPGPNAILVRATLEFADGSFVPIYFGGRRDAVIEPGGQVVSDPLGTDIPARTTAYVRTFVCGQTPTDKWPLGVAAKTELGDRRIIGADSTLGGDMAKVGGLYLYGPSAISGNTDPKASVGVGLLGDSILWGGRESGGLGYGTQGFGVRAIIDSFGYIQASCPGASARRWAVSNKLINRHVLLASADVAIVALGTNDLLSSRTTAKIQADLLTIWTRLAARGIKVFACTIPPLTTSPDGWTSLNQTPSAFEATRLEVNAWLRTNPGPLSGVYDTAAMVTTLNGSGQEIWVPNTCVDGTHPSIQGHAAMATAINTRFFVLGP